MNDTTTLQRLSLVAQTRRARDTDRLTDYLATIVANSGGTIASQRGATRKRGGRVSIIADAVDAVAVMNAARRELDGDTNAYAADQLDTLQLAAFKSSAGGFIGFVNEDYRAVRATS